MASKVFISWGGDLSKKLAEEVKNWLPSVLQFVKPYFTPDDIEKGARWESHIAQELATSNVGIICLTKDNINRPWILFEAGALSKNFGKANVCTVLFNVESSQITGPLTSFQATKFDKADFKKLIKTINDTGNELKLDSNVLDDVFEMWWPRLENKINEIIQNYKEETYSEERTEREMLEEVLDLTRMMTKRMPRRRENVRHVLGALIDLTDRLLVRMVDKKEDVFLFMDELCPILEVLCVELDCHMYFERVIDMRSRIVHMVR